MNTNSSVEQKSYYVNEKIVILSYCSIFFLSWSSMISSPTIIFPTLNHRFVVVVIINLANDQWKLNKIKLKASLLWWMHHTHKRTLYSTRKNDRERYTLIAILFEKTTASHREEKAHSTRWTLVHLIFTISEYNNMVYHARCAHFILFLSIAIYQVIFHATHQVKEVSKANPLAELVN